MVEEELRLFYSRIEKVYSLSDAARIVMRIQALFETVKGKKEPAVESFS